MKGNQKLCPLLYEMDAFFLRLAHLTRQNVGSVIIRHGYRWLGNS